MEKSKILDKMVREGTKLEIRALSADLRNPLRLDAVLIDYDNDGFLYNGRESKSSTDSAFYIPRNALAFMRFSAESLSQENRPTISSPENLEQIQPDADAYSVFGVAYNPKTRELKRGYQKRMMTGEHDQSILSKLFEAGPEKTVSQDTCSMGLTTSKIPYHAVASRIGRLRSILKNFGLTIYKIPNGGYSLREK